MTTLRRVCLGLLALALIAYVAVPMGDTAGAWLYEIIAAGSVVVAWCSVAALWWMAATENWPVSISSPLRPWDETAPPQIVPKQNARAS